VATTSPYPQLNSYRLGPPPQQRPTTSRVRPGAVRISPRCLHPPRPVGVCWGAARDGGQAPACPQSCPQGAVEARRSRVARAPSHSDAKGALDLGGTAPQTARHPSRPPRNTRAYLTSKPMGYLTAAAHPHPPDTRIHDLTLSNLLKTAKSPEIPRIRSKRGSGRTGPTETQAA
jgi:hypothetical protein